MFLYVFMYFTYALCLCLLFLLALPMTLFVCYFIPPCEVTKGIVCLFTKGSSFVQSAPVIFRWCEKLKFFCILLYPFARSCKINPKTPWELKKSCIAKFWILPWTTFAVVPGADLLKFDHVWIFSTVVMLHIILM